MIRVTAGKNKAVRLLHNSVTHTLHSMRVTPAMEKQELRTAARAAKEALESINSDLATLEAKVKAAEDGCCRTSLRSYQ